MAATDGVFLRGGIGRGRHYESPRMLFSEGLVNAYRLESTPAKVPRVIVSPDLWNVAGPATRARCLEDDDGYRFIDYLEWCSRQESAPPAGHPWARHRAHLLRELGRSRGEPPVRAKYLWLVGYHNRKVRDVIARDGERKRGVNRSLLISDEESAVS